MGIFYTGAKWFGIIGGGILGTWVIILLVQALFFSPNSDVIIENVKKLCNYEDLVKAELTQALANSLESNASKWQALKLLQGGELSDCEWQEFLTHLNNVEKRKLKINDLVCDAVNCIP